VHIRGVSERIAFLEKQTVRGKSGGEAPKAPRRINGNQRVLFGDKAPASNEEKQTPIRTKANASTSESERLLDPKAYSLTLAPDQAPDQAPDHGPRLGELDEARPSSAGDGADVPEKAPGVPAESAEPPDPTTDPQKRAKGKPAREVPDQAVTLAHLLLGLICENHPTGRLAKTPERTRDATALRWAETVDKLHRLDGFTWGEIEGMISWCQRDSFWQGVILGADNLRDKWDTMAAQRNRPRSLQQGYGGATQQSAFDVLEQHASAKEQAG
jgi:hypothetical protein